MVRLLLKFDGGIALGDAVGRAILRNELARGGLLHRSLLPRSVIVRGCCPALMLKACVVVLTKENLVAGDSRALRLPRSIRGDNLARAILIQNLYLSHKAGRAVTHSGPVAHHIVEAVAENNAHSILALNEQILHLVRQVHHEILLEGIGNHDIACVEFRACRVVGLVG